MKHLKLTLFLAIALLFLLGAGCQQASTNENEVAGTETTDEQWTTSTDRGDIPDTPMAGTLNGEVFTMASATVQNWGDYHSMSFSSLAPDEACDVIINDDAVNFSTKVLKTGTFEKKFDEEVEFDDYHAYYHYNQEDGTPMSVNVGWEAKVVISEVDEDNNKVKGWARFKFDDEKTDIEGSFEADLCE